MKRDRLRSRRRFSRQAFLAHGLVIACAAALFPVTAGVSVAARSPARLSWSPSSGGRFDFGSAWGGQSVSRTFTLRSRGGPARGALTVSLSGSRVFSTRAARGRCTSTALRRRGSCRVKVVFSPTRAGTVYAARLQARVGHLSRSLTLSASTKPGCRRSSCPPVNTGAPTISGTPQDGQTLAAASGGWSGATPISFAYQWERCNLAGASCVAVAGASSASDVLGAADVGATLRVRVTATNSAGSADAVSAPTSVVVALAPSNTAAPSITGTAREGQTLTASPGLWSGTTPMGFAYQWRSCDSSGSSCVDIALANSTTYTLTPADDGTTIVLRITASNAAGSVAADSQPTAAVSDPQPGFPIRAAFYYPWFPEAWNQQGLDPFTHYTPSLGYYDSGATGVIEQHIRSMAYGNIQAGIASWWGQGTKTDLRFPTLLATTDAMGSSLRWAIYYEPEGQGDPTAGQITADLTYIHDHYAADPAYLRIDGRFVVFVYADPLDGCAMADRWQQANTLDAYIVLKVFPGYRTCSSQPDGWHQYSPAVAEDLQAGHSFTISPGFYKANEAAPRLARDLTRWNQNIRDMIASGAPFQLITTFDEWGEGTAVESAEEWATPSGYGAYLDALHADGS